MVCYKVNVKAIDLNVGDKVVLKYGTFTCYEEIKRIVENKRGQYAVFTDGTWRPIATYGITWKLAK